MSCSNSQTMLRKARKFCLDMITDRQRCLENDTVSHSILLQKLVANGFYECAFHSGFFTLGKVAERPDPEWR